MPLASTARPTRIGRRLSSLPSRIDRLGHQRGRGASCRPLLRPASTSTAAASSAKSCPRLPRRELAAHAAQSGEQQRRSHRRLRGSSETSRQLCGRFFCTPEGRSQRGLRRSPTPKLDAASMGHGAPWQGTQWQRLGSMLLCGCSVTGHLSSGRDLQTGSRAKNGSLQLQEACMTPFRTKGQPDNLISAFRCS